MTDYRKPENRLRPLKAIRLKCLDCSGGSPKEVRLCPAFGCPLWPYRMGKRPKDSSEIASYVEDFESEQHEILRGDSCGD